ncbi:MAG TPA: ribonuclease E inhibitor RraB [Steroidobacteraceae bacterium]|nr:ribonuclease E inhibitor RraB [Steroidobacteraceae bacterium]
MPSSYAGVRASAQPLGITMNGNTSLLLVVLGAVPVVLSLFVWPRIARAQQDPDAQVLAQLRKAGSDLSKPHPIEFFLYVPTKEAAGRLESQVRALHFETKVRPAAQGSQWVVLATKSMVPKQADLVLVRQKFTALAAAEKGEYDGWGTPMVK